MQILWVNNSRMLQSKNAKFSGYNFCMNSNMYGDFQICNSVPLMENFIFWSFFMQSTSIIVPLKVSQPSKKKQQKQVGSIFLTCGVEYIRGFPPIWLSTCKWHHYHTPCSNEFWCVAGKNNQTLDTPKFTNRGHKHFLIAQRHFAFPIVKLSHNLSL